MVDTLSSALRDAIQGSGLRPSRIAREAGISHSAILRFLSGERGLSLSSAGRIANVLGYRLTKVDGGTPNV